jgi:protease I
MKLQGEKVAFLVADHFEDLEFWYPRIRMKEEGADVSVIGVEAKSFIGKNGLQATAEHSIDTVDPTDFDALIIPGGYAPDHMRRSAQMIEFVREMHAQDKILAAICHAGWMLISAGIVKNRRVTSFFSIKDDLINAGGVWEDAQVVVDGRLITSRNPDDLPAFCTTIIEELIRRRSVTNG